MSLSEIERVRKLAREELSNYSCTTDPEDSAMFLRMYIDWLEKEIDECGAHQLQFRCHSKRFPFACAFLCDKSAP